MCERERESGGNLPSPARCRRAGDGKLHYRDAQVLERRFAKPIFQVQTSLTGPALTTQPSKGPAQPCSRTQVPHLGPFFSTVGALVIGIGFCPLYYNYNKEPPNSGADNYLGPYSNNRVKKRKLINSEQRSSRPFSVVKPTWNPNKTQTNLLVPILLGLLLQLREFPK